MCDVFMSILDETCVILETYKGRDKIIRSLCYLSRLVGELQSDPELRKKLSVFGSQMSATRTTLRLLDDILVLRNSLQYGFGKNEPDKYMAVLGVTSNFVDHIFLPLEKVSWLAKHKLLTGIDNSKWDTASSACWVLTSYLTILKTLRFLFLLQKCKGSLDKSISPEKVQTLKTFHLCVLCRASMDFVHAVNTLPPGFLWSSKLKPWFEPDKYMAVLGVTSNFVDHIFLPLEKVSWLAKHKLLTGIDNSKWDTASSACWVLTSYLTILKTLRFLFLLQKCKGSLDKSISPEKVQTLKTFHLCVLCRASMDFVHAVNTLPPGFLWSSKLKPWFVSLVGTSSSLLGLYLIVYKKWLK